MKKIFATLVAVMMVAVAGNAMAYFEQGNLQLVAYERGPADSAGKELHFDLGMGLNTSTGFSNLNTGISLASFGAYQDDDETIETTWAHIKVGIFGGGRDQSLSNVNPLFGSDTNNFQLGNPDAGYRDASLFNSDNLSHTNQKATKNKSTGPYWNYMMGQTTAGIYAGLLVNPSTTFNAETVMNGDIVYGYDLYEMNPATSTATTVGTFTLDTTGTNLLVSYNPVPVPGALVLLGSALLGMIGVRRKNQ
ncbi:MAG: PEP-CTERM sorting domain-containing protein [Pseudomonadota bacterium]